MSVDVATFRVRFPEFGNDVEYSDPRIQLFIDDTLLYIGTDEARWGNKYNIAQSYLAAHFLILGTKSEAGDPNVNLGTASKSAGGVSVGKINPASYSDYSTEDSQLMATSYGQQFMIIRGSCFAGALIANQL